MLSKPDGRQQFSMSKHPHWTRYSETLIRDAELGFSLDASRMIWPDNFLTDMEPAIRLALAEMQELEAGAIANPDEQRMVGHYWLRNPALAPSDELRESIVTDLASAKEFAAAVHSGRVAPPTADRFRKLLLIGIGGSALGPQLVLDALGDVHPPVETFFFDNTDPDGIDRVLARIGDGLKETLTVVVSKSGGTKETRNGMLEAAAAYAAAGLDFAAHAVAVTGPDSLLDRMAAAQGWIKRFPMADWVGGRTSVMSTVGLVPATLQGVNVDEFIAGAAAMDQRTREPEASRNPALMLALAWHAAGQGRGARDMVVLPYKDRLVLLSKYLQQLVMESLGKELDLDGNRVHQGIAVYGNKGSTDQHAYVQQLRDGVDNFFATFIEVLKGRDGASIKVDPNTGSGDYLQGFLRGTREALTQSQRQSVTITVSRLGARELGMLIALYERAVGFYASLVRINAYHQPGVEAGKKAAEEFLRLLDQVRELLKTADAVTADEAADRLDADPEAVFHCLNHLSANWPGVEVTRGPEPAADRFSWTATGK